MQFHVVDGTYELFRAFFGAPSAIVDGKPVGAVRGLVRSLAKWLRAGEITHVGIAFDHVIESFRNQLFDGYKTGEGIDPELAAQFALAEDACRALGLTVWPMVEFEADDALATAAAQLASRPETSRVFIATPDKDLAQCVVGARVVQLDRSKGAIVDEEGVVTKFGVPPQSIPDLLALVGDTADGIPGLPRWGMKSAATVLAHYHHLDAIPEDESTWTVAVRGAAGLGESLRNGRQRAELYRQLATLRLDVPIVANAETMQWRGVDAPLLAEVAARLGLDAGSLRLPAK